MTAQVTLESLERDPTGFLDSRYLRRIVQSTEDALAELGPGRIRLAATLHRFTFTKTSYDDSLPPGLNNPPRDTMMASGDCADQSLLLFSLLRTGGIAGRIVVTGTEGEPGSHAFVEVAFELPPDRVIEALGQFYRETGVVSEGQYWFEDEGEAAYFIADPISSRYIGDSSGLEDMGYVGEDGEMLVTRRFQPLVVPGTTD